MKKKKFDKVLQEYQENLTKACNHWNIMLEEKEKETNRLANQNTFLISKLAEADKEIDKLTEELSAMS